MFSPGGFDQSQTIFSHQQRGKVFRYFMSINLFLWFLILCCAPVSTGISLSKTQPGSIGKLTAIGSDLLMAVTSLIPRVQIPGQDLVGDPAMLVAILHSLEIAYWSLPFGFVLMPIINLFRVPNRRMDKNFALNGLPSFKNVDSILKSPLFKHLHVNSKKMNFIRRKLYQAMLEYSAKSKKKGFEMLPLTDDRMILWTSLLQDGAESHFDEKIDRPSLGSKLSPLSLLSKFSKLSRPNEKNN